MILVTGGTGLLGSHLLCELARDHKNIVAVKRSSSNLEEVKRVFSYYGQEAEELFSRVVWVDVNLCSQLDLESVLERVDQVYHCSAMVSFDPRERRKMIAYNVDSTASVVNACQAAGVRKLVHVSSSSTIGRSAEGTKANETMIWTRTKHSSGYSISKFKSEMEVWRGIEDGLNAVIVNPTIILGPGFWDHGSSSMFSRISKGLRVATPGITGFVGIQDVVTAMTTLMASDISGERFILNSGNHSFLEVFRMISGALQLYGKHPKSRRHFRTVSATPLDILAKLDSVVGIITGTRHLTSEQVYSAFSVAKFSNEKIRKAIRIEFTPIVEVIDKVASIYVKEHPKG